MGMSFSPVGMGMGMAVVVRGLVLLPIVEFGTVRVVVPVAVFPPPVVTVVHRVVRIVVMTLARRAYASRALSR